jgi:hypothetical protein
VRYDQLISAGLIGLGVLSIAVGGFTEVDDDTRRSLFGLGLAATAYSMTGFLWPRSDDDVKAQTTSFLRFQGLAVAAFSAVVLSLYLALGAPNPVSEGVLMLSLTVGLPAALLAPILAKQLILRKSKP